MTRAGGIDVNRPCIRAVLVAVVALAPASNGFTIAELADEVLAQTGQRARNCRTRQAAYDIRKLRAEGLGVKLDRSHRYRVPFEAVRTVTALSVLRDQVIGPVRAGVRSPRQGRKPAAWTRVDRDYETLRVGMQTLFHDLGITTGLPTAASTTLCRSWSASA